MLSSHVGNIWIDLFFRINRFTGDTSPFIGDETLRMREDIREFIPELYGMESACDALLSGREKMILIEAVNRNGRYFSLEIFRDNADLMIMVSDVTGAVNNKRELLQVKNENRLLIEQLEQINRELQQRVENALKTARRNDYRLIEQSRSAMMGEMIANIAHQWRQPLNTLSLMHYSVKHAWESKKMDDDFITKFYEKGKALIEGMSATIDDFRYFFKPADARETFDVSETIAASVSMFELMWKEQSIAIILPTQSGVYIQGYRSQFMQVIVNLLGNARDAMEVESTEEKRVEIGLKIFSDKVVVSVEDTGGGIDSRVLSKIFDPYFSTKGEQGTGLGLYMSRMIIEKNFSGHISVENTPIGAKFTMVFPFLEYREREPR